MKFRLRRSLSIILAVSIVISSTVYSYAEEKDSDYIVTSEAGDVSGNLADDVSESDDEVVETEIQKDIDEPFDQPENEKEFDVSENEESLYATTAEELLLVANDGITVVGLADAGKAIENLELVIPAKYVYINANAFKDNTNIVSLSFEEGSRMREIGYDAFNGCSLNSVSFPSSLLTIGSCAFYNNKLLTINIPGNVKYIGEGAFGNGYYYADVTIDGASLDVATYTGGFAYSSIESLSIRNMVTIPESFFKGADFNETIVTIPKEVKYIRNHAFENVTGLGGIVFEGGSVLESIGERAFKKSGLTSISLPSSLKKIGGEAFALNDLKEIIIPENVSYLGTGTFDNNKNLAKVDYRTNKMPVSEAESGSCFTGCRISQLIIKEGITIIPKHIFWMADFYQCDIVIPKSVQIIGEGAFYEATGIKSITFEEGSCLKRIEATAFKGINLQEIILPATLEYIGEEAFKNNGLSEIVLPISLKTLDSYAFDNNPYLSRLVIESDDINKSEYWCSGIFRNCCLNQIKWGDNCTRIPQKFFTSARFDNCIITIPKTVKVIEREAFRGAGNVSGIVFESGSQLYKIEDYGISSMALTELELPASLKEIGVQGVAYNLFEYIKIPASVKSIGYQGFVGNINLKVAELPSGDIKIGGECFRLCAYGFSVRCAKGTAAEAWAKKNSIPIKYSYKITYHLNGGTNSALNPILFDGGSTISLYAPERTGCTFAGWYKDQYFKNSFTGKTGNANLSLYAKWNYIPYTITFDSAGGSYVADKSYNVATATFSLPTPKLEGYNFMGWYDKDTGVRVTSIAKGSTGNRSLEAHWKENYYIIKFNANGGTGTMGSLDATFTEEITLTDNSFVRTGYYFDGWNTRADGRGTSYADKETVSGLSRTNKATVNLYARWVLVDYSIDYNLDGGANNKKNPTTFYITSKEIKLANPSKTGYTFMGWYKYEDFSGNKVTKIPRKTHEDVVLFAKWQENSYSVAFNLNGGKLLENESIPARAGYMYTDAYDLPGEIAEKQYYTLTGWNTKTTGKGVHYDLNENVSEVYPVNGKTITLYAEWTADSFDIEYILDEGTNNIGNPEVRTHVADVVLKNPSKAGYTFKGWYLDEDFTKKITKLPKLMKDSDGELVENITLYAKWQPNTYKIVFAKNGGTGYMSKQTLTYDAAANLSENRFTRSGYTFVGWNTRANGTGTSFDDMEEVENLKTSGSITLYAIWEKN